MVNIQKVICPRWGRKRIMNKEWEIKTAWNCSTWLHHVTCKGDIPFTYSILGSQTECYVCREPGPKAYINIMRMNNMLRGFSDKNGKLRL